MSIQGFRVEIWANPAVVQGEQREPKRARAPFNRLRYYYYIQRYFASLQLAPFLWSLLGSWSLTVLARLKHVAGACSAGADDALATQCERSFVFTPSLRLRQWVQRAVGESKERFDRLATQLNHIRRILSASEPGVISDKSADACKGRARWLLCRWIMSADEVTKPKYLFFYSSGEFLLVLMRRNHTQAGAARVCVSPMPRELAAAQRVKANFDSVLAVSY